MATITVGSTGKDYTNLQTAINAANLGDVIEVEAGETFTGDFVLPYKTGTGYVTIQSSALASLPAEGTRVAPSNASNMPTIRSANAAASQTFETVSTTTPSHHFKLIGLNIMRHDSTTAQTSIIGLGQTTGQDTLAKVPHHITINRCLIRGTDDGGTNRAIALNARDVEITDCYIDNIHRAGAESQGIYGSNGMENILIGNCFIEGASINFLVGGDDPHIPGFLPKNIVFEHNHVFKRLSWFGAGKGVKNLFELKAAQNVMVRNNIFENNWGDAQAGNSILFTVRNQDGGHTNATIEDVDFEYNTVKNVPEAFNILTKDNSQVSGVANNIRVNNNLILTGGGVVGGNGRKLLIAGDSLTNADAINFSHNTFIGTTTANNWLFTVGTVDHLSNFVMSNNIAAGASGSDHGWIRSDNNNGLNALIEGTVGSYEFLGNLLQRTSGSMPTGNTYLGNDGLSSVGFTDYASGDYSLANGSTYKGTAPGGLDPGANITELNTRTQYVVAGTNYTPGGPPPPPPPASNTPVFIGGVPATVNGQLAVIGGG